MNYNFDEIISRENTNSLKYGTSRLNEPALPDDYIPLWIADMDFACPPEVIEAMHKRLDDRILGYSDIIDEKYFDILKSWMSRRHGWEIRRENLFISSGVVPAVSNLIQILSDEGDRILITTPSYNPFHDCILHNGRVPVYSPLVKKGARYEMDFQDLERKIEEQNVKVFIFCNPHNPTGRVWEEEELRKVAEICMRHHISLISDEIHQDIRRKGTRHIPLASLYPEADWIYTCTAPSKTFNMAGNHMANIFIPNEKTRAICDERYYYLPNPLSIAATQAAYEKCESWLEQLNDYLDNNFKIMKQYFQEQIPGIQFEIPEGTYLAWLDMEGTGLSPEEIKRRFICEAGLHIEDGKMFVGNGTYCIRVNMACPKQIIIKALERMGKVFSV